MADETSAAQQDLLPLSRSVIWRLQRDYYTQRGLEAWTEDMVPSYITNNPFIAEIHASAVAAFAEDCLHHGSPPLSPENPLRILELGAGTGRFACLFLRKLAGFLRESNLAPEIVRYTMSDCSEALLEH